MKLSKLLLALLCAVALYVPAATADDLHYINLFVGDRAAGLGGAYTAIADGPEGAYYNPAGLAFSPASYISLSTNAVQIKNLSYKNIWANSSEPVDYDRNSFTFVPNFFGTIQKDGNVGFALTLASTENEQFDQRDKLLLWDSGYSTNQLVNYGFVQSTNSQELGLSWGILLDPSLSIGFGTFVAYRDSKTIVENIQQLDGYAYFNAQTSYNRRQLVSLRPSLGVQWALSKVVTIGASATMGLPLWAVDTSESIQFEVAATGYGSGSTVSIFNVAVSDNQTNYKSIFVDGVFANTNINTSIGAAFFISSSLLASVSANLYLPVNASEAQYEQALTWNAAAGVEWYITPNFPLRFGLFTNNANTPVISSDAVNYQDHMNMYGASLTFGYATANFDLNIGVTGSLGWGKSQILSNVTDTQDMTGSTLQIFISGSFH